MTFAESMAKQISALSKSKYGNAFGRDEIYHVENAVRIAFKSALSKKLAKQKRETT